MRTIDRWCICGGLDARFLRYVRIRSVGDLQSGKGRDAIGVMRKETYTAFRYGIHSLSTVGCCGGSLSRDRGDEHRYQEGKSHG